MVRLTSLAYRRLLLLIALCVIVAGLARAQDEVRDKAKDDGDADAQQVLRGDLERFAEMTAGVKSLSADFEQQRHTPLLKNPIRSGGRLRIVRGLARWDTAEPFASSMLIADDRLSLYYPDSQTLEVYPLASRLAELSASPVPGLKVWDQHFTIRRTSAGDLPERLRPVLTRPLAEADEADKAEDADEAAQESGREALFLIQLTPKEDELKAYVSALYVQIDPRTGLCRAVGWAGRDGEWTAIIFTGVEVNPQIDRAALRLDPPEGTTVVYPLGPVEPSEQKAD